MDSGAAGMIAFVAALLAFSEIPRQYLAIPIGLFAYATVYVDLDNRRRIRTHTHDSDGEAQYSINGIRGWY